MSEKFIWCNNCYNEYLKKKQELISEFVNDLILMKEYPENDIRDLIKKYEEKLK